MTIWREIEDEDSRRWVVNPWPLAFVCSIALWLMIGCAAWAVVELFK